MQRTNACFLVAGCLISLVTGCRRPPPVAAQHVRCAVAQGAPYADAEALVDLRHRVVGRVVDNRWLIAVDSDGARRPTWAEAAVGRMRGARTEVLTRARVLAPTSCDLEPMLIVDEAGHAVLDAAFLPVALAKPGTRLELDDGTLWAALDLDGGARFIRAAHDRRELAARRQVISAEAAHLSSDDALRLAPVLEIIASVSIVEGDFGDPTRSATDTAVSLGIFQWAAARGRPVALDSSLGRFFSRLSDAAQAGDKLAEEAWARCRKAGISLHLATDPAKATVQLQLRPVKAEVLVARALPLAATGALRTWQLRQALAEVEVVAHALPPSLANNNVVLAIAVSLAVNRPAYRTAVVDAAASDVDNAAADPVRAILRRAIERYPRSDQARRARRFATALLLY